MQVSQQDFCKVVLCVEQTVQRSHIPSPPELAIPRRRASGSCDALFTWVAVPVHATARGVHGSAVDAIILVPGGGVIPIGVSVSPHIHCDGSSGEKAMVGSEKKWGRSRNVGV